MQAYSAADPDALVRFNLVLVVNSRLNSSRNELSPGEWGEFFVHCLDDDSSWVRTEAANALGRVKYQGAVPKLTQLLAEGDDADVGFEVASTLVKYTGQSMFILAGDFGRVDVFEKMVKWGFDVDGVMASGWRPLVFAVAEGKSVTASMLLEHGADVNGANSFGRTALMFASNYGYLDIVRELVAAGADVNIIPTEEPPWPALLVAAQNGHGEVVQLLVANDANVGYRDQNNTTAIELAYNNGHSELARFLIEAWPGPLYQACLPIETEQATADREEEPTLTAHFICRVEARGCKTDPDGKSCRRFLDEFQLDLPAIATIAPWR